LKTCVLRPTGWSGSPRASLVLAAALVTVIARGLSAEASVDGRRTLRRLPVNLGRSVIGVFDADNLRPFVVGAGTAGSASVWDGDTGVPDPSIGFGKALEKAGGWPSAAGVFGVFTAGRFVHGPRFRAMSYDLLNATLVNAGYTTLLKTVVVRERPDQSNDSSFPSGHASNAFTLATVAELHYGWRVGGPAYAVAAAVGVSRIVRDKHYLSDVLAGAALGYIVARTVVRVNGRPDRGAGGGVVLQVSPAFARGEQGVRVALSF